MTAHSIFRPARTVREYGFDVNHMPIEQVGSPTGLLLPWEALDAEAEHIATGRPCQFVVVGEYVRADGIRFPQLGVNPAWMHDQGYLHIEGGPWHLSDNDCIKGNHDHVEHRPVAVR